MPPLTWTAKPDPDSETPASASQRSAIVSVPCERLFIFAKSGSLVVAAGRDRATRWLFQLWDVNHWKRLGEANDLPAGMWSPELRANGQLSADRKFLVAQGDDHSLGVWSLDGSVKPWKIPEPGLMGRRVFGFAGNRIVVVHEETGQLVGKYWDPASKQPSSACRISYPRNSPFRSMALSPRGKYLLCLFDRLQAYELAGGQLVGEAALPANCKQVPSNAERICVSRDGSEIAALTKVSPDAYRLLCWRMHDGQLAFDVSLSTTVLSQLDIPGHNFEFLPDENGWLFGQYVIPRQPGGLSADAFNSSQSPAGTIEAWVGQDRVLISAGNKFSIYRLPRQPSGKFAAGYVPAIDCSLARSDAREVDGQVRHPTGDFQPLPGHSLNGPTFCRGCTAYLNDVNMA